jgi:translocation and assembly module TamB
VVRLVKQIEALSEKKQLLQAVGSPGNSSLLSIDNRQIDFQVADGRVYHRNLEFLVDGVLVQSQGSVGFDQTLSLLIEIPIQDKWIEKKRALRTLAGQSIRIPMQGTFQQPRIDERAVADLSRQLLQGVATEAIGGEINRALDKLFKRR